LHIICDDGAYYNYILAVSRISIGRGRGNDIVLSGANISRRHAEITSTTKGHKVRNLSRSNNIIVNGNIVSEAILFPEDIIEIGMSKIVYGSTTKHSMPGADPVKKIDFEADGQKVIAASQHEDAVDSQTLLVSIGQRVNETPEPVSENQPLHDKLPGKPASFSSIERTNKVLFVLYEISRQLNIIYDFNALLQKMLDLVFLVIDADCGFIILTAPGEVNDLQPFVVKYKDEQTKLSRPINPSRTIIERAIRDKVALLTSNAMDDYRFDAAKSICMQQLRSAICVPLWKKDKIIGIVQLDSFRVDNLLTQDDLELLQAIGSQAAMVIEQASLNEQIREEERMRRQLERFHSPQVVEMILCSGRDGKDTIMEPKDISATILFSDITGFTGLSEKLPVRQVITLLNRYFSSMTDIIFKYEGTLDKYIGDGLMAVFGAPIEKKDDPFLAVSAALEMRSALAGLPDETGMDFPLQIRIGINTGRIVSGNIGSYKRMEYTVIGDAVNTASRLESIAQPGQILIGEETYQRVKGFFSINAIGFRSVKGKASEIMVYEVL